jgi:eukaryotic-like serine/threonine-protein kinase
VAFSSGQTIGDYQIVDVIGSGGMGAVYRVRHLISDRIEAMKIALPDLAGSAELAERFVREIRIQARLTHPNIAALHNALRFENQLLMVMEYVDGIPLSSRVKLGKIDTLLSIEVALQVLTALQYAHSLGVIHRDVKPANIMIAKGGIAKLMDFGIAHSAADYALTHTGAAIGSSYYMSPEQVKSEAVDGRSDIYSLGVVLYEMVTGIKPITGATAWSIMNAHLTQVPIAPAVLDPALPSSLSSAILKALEKEPRNRFESAAAFAGALTTIQQQIRAVPAVTSNPMLETLAAPMPPGSPVAASAVSTGPTPNAVATPTPGTGTKTFSPEDLELVKRHLAAYIGPVARIVVDRAAKKAKSLQALYQMVAEEVPQGKERESFLAKRPL